MTLPTGFTDIEKLSLAAGPNTNAALKKLELAGYEIHVGLDANYASQILAMSQEPSIREYCPRDSAERFASLEATQKWLSKGRAVFLLIKTDDHSLAGYGWAGPATTLHVPDGRSSFAVRIGEAGQGQGLATPFTWLIGAASAANFGLKDYWLETWASNGAAVHIYHKLGFENVIEVPGQRPRPSGERVEDTRIYMELSNQLLIQ